jgi:hypothetical protein
MALKAILTADEFSALPETLQEHYVQHGDGYQLDAEGVEDVTGLKSALEKQKEAARLAKSQGGDAAKRLEAMEELLNSMGGEEGVQMLQKLKGQLEKDEVFNLMSKGDLDAARAKIIERNNADWTKKYQGLESKLNQEAESKKSLEQRLTQLVVHGEIQRAATGMLTPSAVADAVLLGSQYWGVGDDGKTPVMRNEAGELQIGKDGKPLGVQEWLSGLADDRPHWFPGSTGGGTNGGRPNGANRQPYQLTREEAKDTSIARKAFDAAKEAGKAGIEFVD